MSGDDQLGMLALDLLDRVERIEEPLLAWGVSDVGMPEQDVADLASAVIAEHRATVEVDVLLEVAEEAQLLYFDDIDGRVRSRSAETVRLLAHLRQLVHGGDGAQSPHWSARPTLVRDFRFERRARRFPRRDLSGAVVQDAARRQLTPIGRTALRALVTDDDGNDLMLSGFQERSIGAVLDALIAPSPRAVMISAGTGAGKTKAFYLPAFAHVAGLIDASRWTKIIAVYPRQELLKDQFSEAFRQARLLDSVLAVAGRRKLVLGAYYGDVPYTSGSELRENWLHRGGGRVCPYLKCPNCAGDLVRPSSRPDALECSCGFATGADEVLLNRKDMADNPPDVVFMTAEMLNRSLAHLQHGHIVGVGASRPPQVVLLDEVHTYEGTSGAQTALLLRRWAKRVGAQAATYVGLSATLRQPRSFLSQVTGVPLDNVAAVEVRDDELESKGAEYLLALRNDAGAGAATLSTTIQTCMLLSRCIDHPQLPLSGGAFGSKLFAFTDNLDVTNRLFSNLCDAEGRLIWQKPIKGQESLAILRHPGNAGDSASAAQRHRSGQSWDLPLRLGNDLTPGDYVQIGRVHSKDAGVDTDARVIVATASLEVGYDDPAVGAVVQHGAPRDVAQFLQRKGRAGRPVAMRPWTVIVLSEYGRDRLAYESWDLLFNPELPPKHLPVRNRYLLRMHAAAALVDWIAAELDSQLSSYADLWRLLAEPARPGKYRKQNRRDQETVIKLLERLLDEEGLQGRFAAYLADALQIQQADVDEVLWYPPRSILLSAVPTLLRRLQTEWRGEERTSGSDQASLPNPLPEHMSQNLFSALELPEVEVFAERRGGETTSEERMPFDRTMREFCPGNVSRRAATDEQSASHWVPVPDLQSEDIQTVDPLEHYGQVSEHGRVIVPCSTHVCASDGCDVGGHELPLLRPHTVRLRRSPRELSPSSRSFPVWRSSLAAEGTGITVDLPADAPAAPTGLSFHLHAEGGRLEATRAVIGTDGSALWNGTELRYRTRFMRDGEPVSLGVTSDVDAARIGFCLPEGFAAIDDLPAEIIHGVRAAWLRECFERDLEPYANKFKARWLHDAALAAVALETVDGHHGGPREAFEALESQLAARMVAALNVLFERVGDDDLHGAPLRVRDGIVKLLQDHAVVSQVRETLAWLWRPLDGEARGWLRRRLVHTVGLSVLRAAQVVCSDHDPDAVLLDVDLGEEELWLTEVTPGGAGFLEALLRRVASDPRSFGRVVRQALAPSDSTEVDLALRALLAARDSGPLSAAITAFRAAQRPSEKDAALAQLRGLLERLGHPATHPTVAALVARILRPGSTPGTDQLAAELIADRDELERKLGVEVDNRTWAFIASREPRFDGLGSGTGRTARLDAIQSVLWRRGWEADADGLSAWNPYESPPPSAAVVLRHRLATEASVILADTPDALGRCLDALATSGIATLSGDSLAPQKLADVISRLTAHTVDLDVLRSRPRLSSITRVDAKLLAVVELPEVV